jgi:hypothetical protein
LAQAECAAFLKANPEATMSHQPDHAYKLSVLDEIDSTTARAQDTPPTPRRDLSDLEDTLHRAVNMASILVTLTEEALNVYEHYGDAEYHERRRKEGYPSEPRYISQQNEGTLLFALYETHAQIRTAWDLFTGISDDDAPAPAVAEAE